MTSSPTPPSRSAEIKVLSAVALRAAMVELVGVFERDTGASVSIDFDFNPAVARRVESGEIFDVAVTNPHLIDRLDALGLVDNATRAAFGRSPLGLAAHKDRNLSDISSVAGFRETLLAAKSIGYAPEGTSGKRLLSILEQLDLVDAIAGKLRPMAGGYAGHAVAAGEVEYGIVPVSTILAAAPDAVLVGTLPAGLDIQIDFAAALSQVTRNRAVATTFLRFLISEQIGALIASKGIERMGAS